MDKTEPFNRCIFCFAPKHGDGPCTRCGYEPGLCSPPALWLRPGTILKGRYIIGRQLGSTSTQIKYLAWDARLNKEAEAVEYFPGGTVTRDISCSESVSCVPGKEAEFDAGRRRFWENAKTYYSVMSHFQKLDMDFFFRNNTCYYVLAADRETR